MYLQAGRTAESLADLQAAIGLRPESLPGPCHPGPATPAAGTAGRGLGGVRPGHRAEPPIPPSGSSSIAAGPCFTPIVPTSTPEQRAAALRDLEEAIRLEPDEPEPAGQGSRRTRPAATSAEPDLKRPSAPAPGDCACARRTLGASTENLRADGAQAVRRRARLVRRLPRSGEAHRRDPGDPRPGPGGSAELLRRDLRLHPGDRAASPTSIRQPRTRLLNRRGWAYHFADAPRLALDDFEASLKLIEDQSDALGGRGLARIRLGDWRPAVADADAAVRLVKTMPRSAGEG